MSKPQYYDQETFIQNMALEPVWKKELNGKGITVLVTDNGILQHDDVCCNVDRKKSVNSLYYDKSIYENANKFSSHGTAIGALVAGQGKYYYIGCAPQATLIDLNFDEVSMEQLVEYWLKYIDCVDIYTNSWGFLPVDYKPTELVRSFKVLTSKGRKGKGSIIVFSAGNNDNSELEHSGFKKFLTFDTSVNHLLNSRYTISVGATDNNNVKAPFSSRGSSLLCCASLTGTYSNTVKSVFSNTGTYVYGTQYNTVLTASAGSDYGYLPVSNSYTGTSFAAPIISGICALLLQYREDLTWRDVKELISLSCYQPQVDGVRMNGDKRLISELTGFGILNAQKLIKNAKCWKLLSKEEVLEITVPLSEDIKRINLQKNPESTTEENNEKNIVLEKYIPNDFIIETFQLNLNINAVKDKTVECSLDLFLKFLNGDVSSQFLPEFATAYALSLIALQTSDIRITVISPSNTKIVMAVGNMFENIQQTVVPIENAYSQYLIDQDIEKFRLAMKEFFNIIVPFYATFEAYASTWLNHLILTELLRGERTKGTWKIMFNDVVLDIIETISGNTIPTTFLNGVKLIFAGHSDVKCCDK